jgi:hypothetical protein
MPFVIEIVLPRRVRRPLPFAELARAAQEVAPS